MGTERAERPAAGSLWQRRPRMMVIASLGLSSLLLIVLWTRAFSLCEGECSLNGLNIAVPMTAWWLLFTVPAVIVGLAASGRATGLMVSLVLVAAGAGAAAVSYRVESAPGAPTGEAIAENLADGEELLGEDLQAAAAATWSHSDYAITEWVDAESCADIFERDRGAARSAQLLKVTEAGIRGSGIDAFAAELERRGWLVDSATVEEVAPPQKPRVDFRAYLPRGTGQVAEAPGSPADDEAYVVSTFMWRDDESGEELLVVEAWTPCLRIE